MRSWTLRSIVTGVLAGLAVLAGAWLTLALTAHTRLPLSICAGLGSLPFLAYLGALAWNRRRRDGRARAPASFGLDRRDLLGLGLLLFAIVILLHQSLVLGKGLVPADGITRFEPWRSAIGESVSNRLLADQYLELIPQEHFFHDRIVRGSLPLWNPFLACGIPHVASMASASFFPLRLLVAPLDPFAARGLFALIKLFLTGLFTYFYVRRLGVSRSGATLSAMAFSFSAFMIAWLGHPHTNTMMWLPLLLALIEGEFAGSDPPGSTRRWVGFALATGAMQLGGHPPTAVHVSACVGAYFLFRLASAEAAGRRGRLVAGIVTAGIAGMLLAAPQVLPFLEYYFHSSAPASTELLQRSSSHLPPQSFVFSLLPHVGGTPAEGFEILAGWLGLKVWHNFNERAGFFGVTTLVLAFLALLSRRDGVRGFYGVLGLVCAAVAFGLPPLGWILGPLPIIGDIDHTRLLGIGAFAGAVLGGFGLDHLGRGEHERRRLVAFVGIWFGAAGMLGWLWGRLAPEFEHAEYLRYVALQYAIFVATLLIVSLAMMSNNHRRLVRGTCVALASVELLWFAFDYNPSIERADYYPETPGIRVLRGDPSLFRVMALNKVLPANTALMFDLYDARGRDYMSVARYEELIRGESGDFDFFNITYALPPAMFSLNLKYVMTPGDYELPEAEFERIYHSEISIYRLRNFVERAMILRNVEIEPDPIDLGKRMRLHAFSAQQVLLLEEPVTLEWSQSAPVPGVEDAVRIVAYESDRVEIDAALETAGFLLLLDTYFPGWMAYVDGQRVRIHRADYNFRAVALPAGESRVSFEYRPTSFSLGLCLSLMSAGWIAARYSTA